jgi:hypothetical protein
VTVEEADGTTLERLCAHRGAAVPEPTTAALVELAAALDLRPADVLAVGGGEIPGAYLPVKGDVRAARARVRTATHDMADERLAQVRRFVRTLAGGTDRPAMPTQDPVTVGGVFRRLMTAPAGTSIAALSSRPVVGTKTATNRP